MFLKAGALSLALLLGSRLLGLLRESAQAAAFGSSAQADLVVLMLTLPDWLAGVLVSGALSYVLLPAWASLSTPAVESSLRRLNRALLGAGCLLALLLALAAQPVVALLAPGVAADDPSRNLQAVVWSALALPAAMVAGLWVTRLQHGRDFTGMYGANLVVNALLVTALVTAGTWVPQERGLSWVGAMLLLAMIGRLGWLYWRRAALLAAGAEGPLDESPNVAAGARWSVWVVAILLAGLPLLLPVAARSFASQAGAGALVNFNYAWKLVELPLVLAVQLVASIAFPAVTQAMACGNNEALVQAMRRALALAWALACAAAAALLLTGPALASLLFGWGRMPESALQDVARWGAAGAWGLLPQALIAVCLTALAGRERLGRVVLAYGAGLLVLVVAAQTGPADGERMMRLLNAVLAGVAAVALASLGREAWQWVPWGAISGGLAALMASLLIGRWAGGAPSGPAGVLVAVAAAAGVLALAAVASSDLRHALRR